MSRWLSSMNTLLTQLDGQAEIVAEEHLVNNNQDEGEEEDQGGALDSILAKRGLSSVADEEEDDADIFDANDEKEAIAASADEEQPDADGWDDVSVSVNEAEASGHDDIKPPVDVTAEAPPSPPPQQQQQQEEEVTEESTQKEDEESPVTETKPGDQQAPDANSADKGPSATEEQIDETSKDDEVSPADDVSPNTEVDKPVPHPPPPPPIILNTTKETATVIPKSPGMPRSPFRPPSSSPSNVNKQKPTNMIPKSEFVQIQKEARTLRRHVVSLNTQLEAAESELSAQRSELEHAAERMEKDRAKNKKQLEDLKQAHAQQVATMQKQHDQALLERQARLEQERHDHKNQVVMLESKRQQEGGDWNKELATAVEQQQESAMRMAALEDEKAVLLSQLSTLQSQQEALGSRLESLTHTSDNAMEREREAEERLDAVLTQHARQITQRQARESELERTVQELGAALVAARSGTTTDSFGAQSKFGEGDTGAGDPLLDVAAINSKVQALEQELSSAHSQLQLEREKGQALHHELKHLSKETTQEASEIHAREVHYERQLADLNLTVSKLQANLRAASTKHDQANGGTEADTAIDDGLAREVKLLSEEVLRLRSQLSNQNGELLTLKNRVKSANDRAQRAEDDLTMALANTGAGSDSLYDSMERNPAPSSGGGLSRRRRNVQSGSIRSAIHLLPGQGDRAENLGKAVDVVDEFAVSTGKYLRRNPLARAVFIVYLLLIHSWSFVLLFFHAHSFENVHGDFGAGNGPHELMKQSNTIRLAPPSLNIDEKVIPNKPKAATLTQGT